MARALYVPPIPNFDSSLTFLAIHGDKQQNERDWVLNEFKQGKSPIMVATDVASRGIGMNKLHPLSLFPPSPIFHPPPGPLKTLTRVDVV
jgi:hypothetical protein